MTTSLSKPETSLAAEIATQTPPKSDRVYRIKHTLASRFAFLILTVAIVLSALAYGTVHYWTLALFSLGAVTILVLWVVDGWKLGFFRINKNFLQLPLLGMIVLGCVQLLPLRSAGSATTIGVVDFVRTLSLDPYSTRLVLVQVTALLIYFAATLVFTDTPHRLRLLVRTIIVFGFLLAIFGLTQSFTSPNRVYWVRELAQATAFGPFINRHHFAGYMELTLALPLGLLFSGSIAREKRFIYLFVAGIMAVALVITNSRGGIISLVAEIFFLTAIGFRRKHKHRTEEGRARGVAGAALRAGLALVLIVALFGAVVLLGGESALSRFVGTVNLDDPTTGRAHFWNVTVDIIKAHPVIGTGLGAFGVVYTEYDTRNGLYRLEQAHNDYLQVLSDAGLVGAFLGLAFVVMLFKTGFSRRESRDDYRRGVAIGALSGCFAVLVHSFFDFTLHTTSNALLFLVLAGLATMNGRVEEVQSRRRRVRRTSEGTAVGATTSSPSSSPAESLDTAQN
jgi:O-antigen ligase